MRKRYETVIYDLDGTLLNTLEDLTDSTNYAMEQMGYPRHTLEEVRSFVNNGARKLILGACPPSTTAIPNAPRKRYAAL